ncbi:Neutral ceramidase A, partial [Termitomyces sp. J132]
IVFDAAPIGNVFGDVLVDVNTTPYHACDTVSAQFVGANPRASYFLLCDLTNCLIFPLNNLHLKSTFLTVDQLVNGQWKTVHLDCIGVILPGEVLLVHT